MIKNTNDPSELLATGGGAATSSGVLFQQHVGALIGGWLLADLPLLPGLELGTARPLWLRFETEAPVDDILVGTSSGGFVAFQVKTTLASSRDRASPYGKAVDQLVRHWLVCRDGDGSLSWNRPLNPELDRLVIAVSPKASAKVRLHLPSALKASLGPGKPIMTKEQQDALADFEECVRKSWSSATNAAYSDTVLHELARLVAVLTVDTDSSDIVSSLALVTSGGEALAAASILEQYCGNEMARRGGFDAADLRRNLLSRGASLGSTPTYRADIERLKAHSVAIRESLTRYEVIRSGDGRQVGIERDFQSTVETAAREGSLLIVGEPGAGKSGVLNALSRSLSGEGCDVLELAVDRYSVETLQGLTAELQLEHPLLDVLDAWDGNNPAWLIVDALDATRGGKGEGAFRTLIEQVLSRKSRWRVVASIRTFDLRMGRKFRELFKGRPPIPALSESEFAGVRHVRVPQWTKAELDRLLASAPAISNLLAQAPDRLRDLALVPFNTRLLGELIEDGEAGSELAGIATQAELLRVYWDHRVGRHGYEAEACLHRIVGLMVGARALRAPRVEVIADFSQSLQLLVQEGVLITAESDRWIQFRHHLLFDYVASRVYLDPEALVNGTAPFTRSDGLGLMLAPALSFVLQELWANDRRHEKFWSSVSRLVADDLTDPVVRSVASRAPAELSTDPDDVEILARSIAEGSEQAIAALPHIIGALSVRLDDGESVDIAPWVRLAVRLAPAVSVVAWPLRLLCFLLIGRTDDPAQRKDLGVASRALLEYALGSETQGFFTEAAIGFVADTYATDPAHSRALLSTVFEDKHFMTQGWGSIPALARKIDVIAPIDPDFAKYVYGEVYRRDISIERETSFGDSQILPLRSNAKQDYEMARYGLSEYFAKFLELDPIVATQALVLSVDGYVARDHPISPETREQEIDILGETAHLLQDYSHIWAHDPDAKYAHDGEVLVAKFQKYLRTANEDDAVLSAKELAKHGRLGIYWSRLFMAAADRGGELAALLFPYACNEAFLLASDTRKDAIDLVAKCYAGQSEPARRAFEDRAQSFDFSSFGDPAAARELILSRLFGAIGRKSLVTASALELLEANEQEGRVANNRPFAIRSSSRKPDPYFWLEDLDTSLPPNSALISAIDVAKAALGLGGDTKAGSPGLAIGVSAIDRLMGVARAQPDAHQGLLTYAQGVVAEGAAKLAGGQMDPAPAQGADPAESLVAVIEDAARSSSPEVEEETEAKFADSPGWGSPAPRVEAAEAALDVLRFRPNFYERLIPTIDLLLSDPHPAVRLQTIVRLIRLWDIDRDGFWARVNDRAEKETNRAVLEHLSYGVLGSVFNADPDRAEIAALTIHSRFCGQSKVDRQVREPVAKIMAHLWVGHERVLAMGLIDSWLSDLAVYRREVRCVVTELRDAYVLGLYGRKVENSEEIRGRAQALLHAIVSRLHDLVMLHFERITPSEAEKKDAGRYLRLLDTACMELYFAAESLGKEDNQDGEAALFVEIEQSLKLIGDVGAPHTIYYLLQLLERFVPHNPGRVFDLLANALLVGGRRLGYQYESMGADLLVRLVGTYLADYREVFEDKQRRQTLIECLDVFMKAGWPAARRLLYRLPDLVQ